MSLNYVLEFEYLLVVVSCTFEVRSSFVGVPEWSPNVLSNYVLQLRDWWCSRIMFLNYDVGWHFGIRFVECCQWFVLFVHALELCSCMVWVPPKIKRNLWGTASWWWAAACRPRKSDSEVWKSWTPPKRCATAILRCTFPKKPPQAMPSPRSRMQGPKGSEDLSL
jgi:hypothetical protein